MLESNGAHMFDRLVELKCDNFANSGIQLADRVGFSCSIAHCCYCIFMYFGYSVHPLYEYLGDVFRLELFHSSHLIDYACIYL